MRIALAILTLVVCCGAWLAPGWAQQPAVETAKPLAARTARSAEEKVIRQAAESFVEAYNAHDPQAIAALFGPGGELVDSAGHAESGRPAIERVFAAVFEESPAARMSITIESVRFVGASLAVEDGVATVVHQPGEAGEPNRYTATHLKHADGKWLLASVRDLEAKGSTAAGELEQLSWLIGDWIDESSDSLVATSYQWADNHCYILSEFTIRVAGNPVMTGSQRIGWDPLARVVRNWVFDSEGGFATGVFSRDANRWIIKQTGVTRDGEPVWATNTITEISRDRFSWESRDRVLGGVPMPDVGPVTVVRRPPKAGG